MWKHSVSFLLFILIWCDFNNLATARTSKKLKVRLPDDGILVGRHWTSHKGRSLRAFLGIPYAQPPIGLLRFYQPLPYISWDGERLAIQDAPECMHRDLYTQRPDIYGKEDCLYLNVYTPENANPLKPLPVMVYFHDGGLTSGSSLSQQYRPDYLLDHDIVLVTGNYRLGVLGFLSTEYFDCPGNFGLKDQVEMLRWVKKNIKSFGGDPKSVTIFGNGFGAASITYHLWSNLSKGLFHKAIVQSGTYFNPWAQPQVVVPPLVHVNLLGILTACNGFEYEGDMMRCLRMADARDLVGTSFEFYAWDFNPIVTLPPVYEPPHEGAFLTHLQGRDELPHGFFLPLMIGATSEEGLVKTIPLVNTPDALIDFKLSMKWLLAVALQYEQHNDMDQLLITDKIQGFYFKNGPDFNKYDHTNLTAAFSDALFLAGIDKYIRMRMNAQLNNTTPPFYVYLFEQRVPASFTELLMGGSEKFSGVCHGDELQYLFPLGPKYFPTASPTADDVKLREAMVAMWVNFAKEGNPTPAGSNLPLWEPAKEYPVRYARLGNKHPSNFTLLEMQSNMFEDRLNFWHELKPHLTKVEREFELTGTISM